jgi:hypothetical protein
MARRGRALTMMALAGSIAAACTTNPQIQAGSAGGNGGSSSGAGGKAAGGSGVKPDFSFDPHDAGSGAGGTGGMPRPSMYSGGITRPCTNLECRQTTCVLGDCKQKTCMANARTTLGGRVYDPGGKVPLYNIVVYVPNGALDDIKTGPSCDRCDSPVSGMPIASALTDTKGDFLLDNVPVGSDVPLVIQIGKWRRKIVLPPMNACSDNKVQDPQLLRLPRTQKEGNIPRIALTTGGYDRLECLLRKIGIDDSEFTPEGGSGRVNLYGGRGNFAGPPTLQYAPMINGGATFTPATSFWGEPANLKKYDMVVLSCEGDWNSADKSPAARQGLVDYANLGGRVFASHWHGVWIQLGPAPWNMIGNFVPASPSGLMDELPDLPNQFATDVDSSFPKGAALAEWLVNVQASMVHGKLPITDGQHTLLSVDTKLARPWITSSTIPASLQSSETRGVQYVTFNAPVGGPAGMECGRTVFTDIHVSAGDMAGPPFPGGCVTPDLSPQEKALEFMLFDLSSCIQPDQETPRPPLIP